MGQALGEATRYDPPHGLPARANFLDYRFPTIADSPPIETHLVEARDPNGPFGAKEASEARWRVPARADQRRGRRHRHPAARAR